MALGVTVLDVAAEGVVLRVNEVAEELEILQVRIVRSVLGQNS